MKFPSLQAASKYLRVNPIPAEANDVFNAAVVCPIQTDGEIPPRAAPEIGGASR